MGYGQADRCSSLFNPRCRDVVTKGIQWLLLQTYLYIKTFVQYSFTSRFMWKSDCRLFHAVVKNTQSIPAVKYWQTGTYGYNGSLAFPSLIDVLEYFNSTYNFLCQKLFLGTSTQPEYYPFWLAWIFFKFFLCRICQSGHQETSRQRQHPICQEFYNSPQPGFHHTESAPSALYCKWWKDFKTMVVLSV